MAILATAILDMPITATTVVMAGVITITVAVVTAKTSVVPL